MKAYYLADFFLLGLLLASIVCTCLLSTRPLVAQGVYIDENAYLSGQATVAYQNPAHITEIDDFISSWYVACMKFALFLLLYTLTHYHIPYSPHSRETCVLSLFHAHGWEAHFTKSPLSTNNEGVVIAHLFADRSPASEVRHLSSLRIFSPSSAASRLQHRPSSSQASPRTPRSRAWRHRQPWQS